MTNHTQAATVMVPVIWTTQAADYLGISEKKLERAAPSRS